MRVDEWHQGEGSSIAKLFPEALKAAFIDHVIQIQLVRELSGTLLAQLDFLDLDVDAFIVRRDDQEGDPIGFALECRQLLILLGDKQFVPEISHGYSSCASAC